VNTPLPGVPRLPNGTPNLGAPVPHTPDGTPDLSGVWAAVADRTDVPLDSTPIPRSRAGGDIALGVPGGAPLTAWAKEVHAVRRQSRTIPTERCLPSGLRLTERFRRLDYGHMEIDYTFEDPKLAAQERAPPCGGMIQPIGQLFGGG
jgi:hypothetical protein